MSISVVIPAYNAEKTLCDAVFSAFSICNDVEIIVIDDCSTDSTYFIAEELSNLYPNVFFIHLPSKSGVSIARNVGIKNAKKNWITFLDADDVFCADIATKYITNSLNCRSFDFVLFLHKNTARADNPYTYQLPVGDLSKSDMVNLVIAYLSNPRGHSIVTHCWAKIFSKNFLLNNSLFFDENLSIYEDTKFVANCLNHANAGYFSNSYLYSYLSNAGLSKTFSKTPLAFVSVLDEFQKIVNNIDLINRANSAFFAKVLYLSKSLPFRERVFLYRFLKKDFSLPEMDHQFIQNSTLRIVIKFRLWRYPVFCSIIIRFLV